MLLKAEAGQLETSLAPEFGVIAALGPSDVPAPPALWCDESGEWLGQPFFVTGHVGGTASMRPLRVETVRRRSASRRPRSSAGCSLPPQLRLAVGLDAVPRPGYPGWCRSGPNSSCGQDQFERQRVSAQPGLRWAFEWLRANAPAPAQVSIVHGDLRFGNLLYEGPKLMALLDWEMTHLGDPTEDLGWVYRDLWSPRWSLPFDDFLAAYEQESGYVVDRDRLRWYQAFAEAKHAVISLTGARSFHDRLTLNLRHADRAATVGAFLRRFYELVPA